MEGSTEESLLAELPQTARVNLAYHYGTADLPVVWNTASIQLDRAGDYDVTGIVQSIGANKDQWIGKDASTNYLAEDKTLYSSNAMIVKINIIVE